MNIEIVVMSWLLELLDRLLDALSRGAWSRMIGEEKTFYRVKGRDA